MPARTLWTAGILLVAIGVAAHAVGWETLLWLPRRAMDSLLWAPRALMEAVRESPLTTGLIILGVVLMVLSRVAGRK